MNNGSISAKLLKVKETKNMVRYGAPGDEEQQRRSNIPNIYIRKDVLGAAFSEFPSEVLITVQRP